MAKEKEITIPVQVNGKLRAQMIVSVEDSKNQKIVEENAKNDTKVNVWIQKDTIKKVVFVPGKLINFVVA